MTNDLLLPAIKKRNAIHSLALWQATTSVASELLVVPELVEGLHLLFCVNTQNTIIQNPKLHRFFEFTSLRSGQSPR